MSGPGGQSSEASVDRAGSAGSAGSPEALGRSETTAISEVTETRDVDDIDITDGAHDVDRVGGPCAGGERATAAAESDGLAGAIHLGEATQLSVLPRPAPGPTGVTEVDTALTLLADLDRADPRQTDRNESATGSGEASGAVPTDDDEDLDRRVEVLESVHERLATALASEPDASR